MKKKWKRSRKQIMVIILSITCLVGLAPPFDSLAYSYKESKEFSFYHIYPRVYGNLDNTTIIPLKYSQNVFFDGGTEFGKKYGIFLSAPYSANPDFLYPVSDKQYVSTEISFTFAGREYFTNGVYALALVEGNGDKVVTVNFSHDVILGQYSGSDGYIYQNSCQLSLVSGEGCYFTLYELDDSDLDYFQQLSEIISYLAQDKASDDLIRSDINKILLSNIRIEDMLEQVLDLLVQVYGQDTADKIVMDNFQQNSSSQSSQLGQLNQENKVDKIDINNASATVDSNIDMESVGQYGLLLTALTGNSRVVQMIVIALSVSLVGFIFFGKR